MSRLLIRCVCVAGVVCLAPARGSAQDEDRPVYKSAYRIINAHRHCDSPSVAAVKAELAVLDRTGVDTIVVLDGGTSDGKLPAWIQLRQQFPERLIVFGNLPWGRSKQPGFFESLPREIADQHRLGVQGLKIFKQLG
ncbi:MAG: hypothetical protein AB7K24_23960, partial [Gemmataceae bacterium]